jgi:hypothetical protein
MEPRRLPRWSASRNLRSASNGTSGKIGRARFASSTAAGGLWVFLGVIAVALLLTVGLVVGFVFVIFRILGGILRAIFR